MPAAPNDDNTPAGSAETFRPRRLLLLLAILALIVAGGALVDATIERNAPAVARGFIRGDLRVAGVSSHVLLTRLTLTGVSWKAPDGAPIFSARRVSIHWSPLSLLRRGIVLDRLALEQPRLSLSRAAGGGWNVVDAIPALGAPSSARSAPVVIDRFVINHGAMRLDDRAQDIALSLDGVSSDAALGLPGLAVRGKLAASGGAFTRAGERRTLGPLRLAAHLDDGALAIDDARVSLGTSRVRAEGRVGRAIGLSDLDLHLRGDLVAEDLRALVPALDRLRGAITIDVHVTGSASRPRAQGEARGSSARAWAFPMDNLRVRFDYTDPLLRLRAIDLAALGGQISGSGTLDAARHDYRLDLRCRDISGMRLVNLLLAGPPFEDARAHVGRRTEKGIYERLEGTVDLAGSGFTPERMKGTASLLFRAPGQAPGTAGAFFLDAFVRVDQGELRFERLRLDSADLRVRVGNPVPAPSPAGAGLPQRSATFPGSG